MSFNVDNNTSLPVINQQSTPVTDKNNYSDKVRKIIDIATTVGLLALLAITTVGIVIAYASLIVTGFSLLAAIVLRSSQYNDIALTSLKTFVMAAPIAALSIPISILFFLKHPPAPVTC